MEARLDETLGAREAAIVRAVTVTVTASPAEASEGVTATIDTGPAEEPNGANWPDDSVESAFLAEAKERGEPVVAKPVEAEPIEEGGPKTLPPLDELVKRIPADVRETLEELFRARFVTVKRVPKKALK